MDDIRNFIAAIHPYDSLSQDELARVAASFSRRDWAVGEQVYRAGEVLEGIWLIVSAGVAITDANGAPVSELSRGNSFGERGLMTGAGLAVTNARVTQAGAMLMLPRAEFQRLLRTSRPFARFFRRGSAASPRGAEVATLRVADLMSGRALACRPDTTITDAARMMRDAHISSLGVTDAQDMLLGIVTIRDMSAKVVAGGLDASGPVSGIMTANPAVLTPSDIGSDVLGAMLEHNIGHLPIVEQGRFVGMVTQTDLTRLQAVSSQVLLRDLAGAPDAAAMAQVTARIPELLVQQVSAHQRHEVTTRLITDVADAVTRRLLALAEATLGPPPAPYLWAACGSQGRREQTGTSDQDNCLILDDSADPNDPYFEKLARFVSDGLHQAGYVYCPGDMMATNPRWRQPRRVWREYFHGWITTPNPEAQMLASVMFDLRAIAGEVSLLEGLQAETLQDAAKNSIFVAHMIGNSLKHRPPLGMIRGFATIRSGEHRNQIDMKANGVVPVTDLARVYALRGQIEAVNTRERLLAAQGAGIISDSGGQDLVAAYDLIQTLRLENQAEQVREGRKPDNYLAPSDLADFQRSHLRDAFVVVRTMQSAVGHGKGAMI
ncbi:MAG: DUF294 nucleotidyltransferase-like domain-containing protein [Paracoccus sp. (in: a-proteobacteria)]|uniref:DUF294 nucleotidyltransferase-like domain-containing protein n=1 Tax=Paracoccus sp. TaxID=267 RepID=UPI0026DF0D09|nr:DUF294 nucleotidyltransferase-like domain-containing protein [Paracoccus sp. (in: a-proteobacteria)]MDO5622051.1 DUF294 nucleotidyltransferase-like domain-containing protein [Paracoccus sp. (in: a-proteobacteria)]